MALYWAASEHANNWPTGSLDMIDKSPRTAWAERLYLHWCVTVTWSPLNSRLWVLWQNLNLFASVPLLSPQVHSERRRRASSATERSHNSTLNLNRRTPGHHSPVVQKPCDRNWLLAILQTCAVSGCTRFLVRHGKMQLIIPDISYQEVI